MNLSQNIRFICRYRDRFAFRQCLRAEVRDEQKNAVNNELTGPIVAL